MAAACPTPEKLEQLLLGKLSNRESRQLEQHLLQCRECCNRVEQLSASDHLVAALRKGKQHVDMPSLLQKVIQQAKQMPPGEETDASQQAETQLPSQDASRVQAMASRFPEEFNLLAPPQQPGEVGRLGGYRVLGVIGSGGMGVVFLAEDPQLQRSVALKVMKPSLARNPRAKERFLREARAMAAVEHECIVPIYQVGEEGGVPFIAMPLLRGQTLQEYLRRKKALPPLEAVRIARQVAAALAAAHKRGLIHRDIKPANIWLEKNGRVRLLDFGLARPMGQDSDLTHTGAVVGTPNYMAPEQARGEKLDSRCDLFSLGAVLYHMLSGRRPFGGKTLAMVLAAVMQQEPPPLDQLVPGLPPELVRLVHRLLAKYPTQRPQTAAEVYRELTALEKKLQSTPPGEPQPPQPPTSPGAGVASPPSPSALPSFHSELQEIPVRPSRKRGRRRIDPLSWFLFLAGGMAAVVLLVMMAVFFLRTDKGVIRVEINDPQVEVQLKGTNITLRGVQGGKDIQVEPGPHALVVRRGDFQFETNRLILRRGQRVTVQVDYIQGQVVVRQGTRELARAQVPQRKRKENRSSHANSPVSNSNANPPNQRSSLADKPAEDQGTLPSSEELSPEFSPQAIRSALDHMSIDQLLEQLRPRTQPDRLVYQALDLSRHALRNDPAQLAFQMHGRLLCWQQEHPALKVWASQVDPRPVTLRLLRPTLNQSGGSLLRVMEFVNPSEDIHGPTLVAVTPDGRHVVSGGGFDAFILWELATGRQIRVINKGRPRNMALSPDGRFLVWVSKTTGEVKITELATGQILRSLTKNPGLHYWSVAVSPSGRYLAAGASNLGSVSIWKLGTGHPVSTLQGPKTTVLSVAIAPDDHYVVAGCKDGVVRVWELETGRLVHTLQGHQQEVTCVAITPEGRYVVTGSADNTVRVWKLGTGRLVHTLRARFVRVSCLAITPDGRFVITGSGDSQLRLWELETGRLVHTAWSRGPGIASVAVSPDGRYVVSGSFEYAPKIYEFKELPKNTLSRGYPLVLSVAVSPDGRYAVLGSALRVSVEELQTGQQVHILPDSGRVTCVATTPDGRYAVSTLDDKRLRVWELATGRLVRTLSGHQGQVRAVAITPDGRYAVSGSADRTLRVWELETGRTVHILRGHQFPVAAVAITPDGRYAVSGSVDRTLRVWELETGRTVRILRGHHRRVAVVAITPDGRYAVSGSADRTLRVWELETGRLLRTMQGHLATITGVSISPNGSYLVSCSRDFTLRVWNLATGTLLSTFTLDTCVNDCQWGPHGRFLVATAGTGGVHVFRVVSRGHNTVASAGDQGSGASPQEKSPQPPDQEKTSATPAPQGPRPPVAVAPFGSKAARAYQEAWAKYLGVPVEKEVDLGGGVKMQFVLIPPGEFEMGTADVIAREKGKRPSWLLPERPLHRVRITRPFYFGKTEVTVGQFSRFVEQTRYQTVAEQNGGAITPENNWKRTPGVFWKSPGFPQKSDHPVTCIALKDAEAFCSWMSELTGKRVLLPTEAQWEYACRAGTTDHYYWPRNAFQRNGTRLANLFGIADGYKYTAPVGRFPPNPFGLYNMLGNVREHTQDMFDEKFYSKSPLENPVCRVIGAVQIRRGSFWSGNVRGSHCAARHHFAAYQTANTEGFRVVLNLETDDFRPHANRPLLPRFAAIHVDFRTDDPEIRVHFKDKAIVLVPEHKLRTVTLAAGSGTVVAQLGDKQQSLKYTLAAGERARLVVEKAGSKIKLRWESGNSNKSAPSENQAQDTQPPAPQGLQPPVAVAPFGPKAARAYQEAWAKYLGVPVEKEVDLGGGVKMQFVLIPPGEFFMGLSEHEGEVLSRLAPHYYKSYALDQERPLHKVQLTVPFYLAKFETTRGQFARFVQETNYVTVAERQGGALAWSQKEKKPYRQPGVTWKNDAPLPKFTATEQHAVTVVSKADAEAFCNWLARKIGQPVRLPSEAQWEFACRAGTSMLTYFANDTNELSKWVNGAGNKDGFAYLAPVGRFPANPFGLHDMLGNAAEVCRDAGEIGFYKHSPIVDPVRLGESNLNLYRGGSWSGGIHALRSARRWTPLQQLVWNVMGFRVALPLQTPPAVSHLATKPAPGCGVIYVDFNGNPFQVVVEGTGVLLDPRYPNNKVVLAAGKHTLLIWRGGKVARKYPVTVGSGKALALRLHWRGGRVRVEKQSLGSFGR